MALHGRTLGRVPVCLRLTALQNIPCNRAFNFVVKIKSLDFKG
jgi:hypothetical protein